MPKERLDQRLVRDGLAETREKAQRLIRSGRVRVQNQVESKPGKTFAVDCVVEIEQPDRYVSRGGEKLEGALAQFDVPIRDRIAMDIGASTGGFTDCLLQNGARKVYAVDVGHGQLHWNLRQDPRVVVMEKFNARNLSPSDLPEVPSLGVADVSFISLTRILGPMARVLAPGGDLLTLIKPQFEAGREQVGKGGVVRDPAIHKQVVAEIREFGTADPGLQWVDVCESPIRGPAGNIEFLAWWKKP